MFHLFNDFKRRQFDELFESLGKIGNDSMFTSCTTEYKSSLPESYKDSCDNVDEHGNRLIYISLPGHNKDTIKISLDGKMLIVESKFKSKLPPMAKSFIRKYALIGKYLEDKISAEFTDGILKITIPFESQNVKEIKIK